MSIARAQREIDSEEFAWWRAYYDLEPWGEKRADLRAGIVAAVVANANRGKRSRAFKASEFMPQFERRPGQRMNAKQIEAVLDVIPAAKKK